MSEKIDYSYWVGKQVVWCLDPMKRYTVVEVKTIYGRPHLKFQGYEYAGFLDASYYRSLEINLKDWL